MGCDDGNTYKGTAEHLSHLITQCKLATVSCVKCGKTGHRKDTGTHDCVPGLIDSVNWLDIRTTKRALRKLNLKLDEKIVSKNNQNELV